MGFSLVQIRRGKHANILFAIATGIPTHGKERNQDYNIFWSGSLPNDIISQCFRIQHWRQVIAAATNAQEVC